MKTAMIVMFAVLGSQAFAAESTVTLSPQTATCAQAQAVLTEQNVLELRKNFFVRSYYVSTPDQCENDCGNPERAQSVQLNGQSCDLGYLCPGIFDDCNPGT